MALTRTNRTSDRGEENDTVFVSTAFTPSDSSLLVALVYAYSSAGDITGGSTVTGGGLTWTRRALVSQSFTTIGTTYGVFEIWTAPVATGASMQITATYGFNINSSFIQAVDYTGYNTGSPVGGTGTDATLEDAGTFNLSAAPVAGDITIAGRAFLGAANPGATPATGWTEIYDAHSANANHGDLQSQDRGSSTSASVDWDDTHGAETVNWNMGAAIVVKVAADDQGALSATGLGSASFVGASTAAGALASDGLATVAFVSPVLGAFTIAGGTTVAFVGSQGATAITNFQMVGSGVAAFAGAGYEAEPLAQQQVVAAARSLVTVVEAGRTLDQITGAGRTVGRATNVTA